MRALLIIGAHNSYVKISYSSSKLFLNLLYFLGLLDIRKIRMVAGHTFRIYSKAGTHYRAAALHYNAGLIFIYLLTYCIY